jgi:hypothetical protein
MERPAGTRPFAARRRVIAIALGCGLTLGGCLVTDSVEPPPVPNFPPLVLSTYTPGSAILFDASKTTSGLVIPFEIRDEDTSEVLKPRWRVTSGSRPQSTGLDYTCPEIPIPGTGSVIRSNQSITVSVDKFVPGSCSVVELIVSAHFLSCSKYPEPGFFDVTTNADDNDAALGRAFFWVWETSNNPLTDNAKAQQLLSSCPKAPYQTAAPTPGATTIQQPP